GYEVTACRTGADALIVLGQSTFHVVLLDNNLPDMKGLQLLETLTRDGIATPVVLMTGYGDERLATQALQAGAAGHLPPGARASAPRGDGLAFLPELPKRPQEPVPRHRLQQSNHLLIAALESARDGICITDLQGAVLHVNRALEAMTGYGRQELVGRSPPPFQGGADGPEPYAALWRTVRAADSWRGEGPRRR